LFFEVFKVLLHISFNIYCPLKSVLVLTLDASGNAYYLPFNIKWLRALALAHFKIFEAGFNTLHEFNIGLTQILNLEVRVLNLMKILKFSF
jgi:hypothetical protein